MKYFRWCLLLLLSVAELNAQVYLFEIEGEVNTYTSLSVQKAISDAEKQNCTNIIFKINTLGGTLKDAITIRKAIDQTQLKTIGFVNDNAASAGAIIALSCNKLYMSPSAGMGAATPVLADGSPASEKVNSYVRSLVRASALKTGKSPENAEKMVGIPGEKYKVASLTAGEAIAQRLADGMVMNVREILMKESLENQHFIQHKQGWQESFMAFVLQPWVSVLLLIFMVVGIKWELAAPGFGFPGMLGLICAALFFIPHQLYGLAEYWEIGMFFLGVVLIGLEIFVLPGFGISGISGLLMMGASIGLSLMPNDGFNFQAIEPSVIVETSGYIVIGLIAITLGVLWFLPRLLQSKALSNVTLQTSLDTDQGFTSDFKPHEMVGKEGIVHTVLKPAGKVLIENNFYDAIAEGDYIEPQKKVVVVESSGNFLKVRRVK